MTRDAKIIELEEDAAQLRKENAELMRINSDNLDHVNEAHKLLGVYMRDPAHIGGFLEDYGRAKVKTLEGRVEYWQRQNKSLLGVAHELKTKRDSLLDCVRLAREHVRAKRNGHVETAYRTFERLEDKLIEQDKRNQ